LAIVGPTGCLRVDVYRRFDIAPTCDRQTDRRTDGYKDTAYTALAQSRAVNTAFESFVLRMFFIFGVKITLFYLAVLHRYGRPTMKNARIICSIYFICIMNKLFARENNDVVAVYNEEIACVWLSLCITL